jgi:hypothetical protein
METNMFARTDGSFDDSIRDAYKGVKSSKTALHEDVQYGTDIAVKQLNNFITQVQGHLDELYVLVSEASTNATLNNLIKTNANRNLIQNDMTQSVQDILDVVAELSDIADKNDNSLQEDVEPVEGKPADVNDAMETGMMLIVDMKQAYETLVDKLDEFMTDDEVMAVSEDLTGVVIDMKNTLDELDDNVKTIEAIFS